MINSPAYTPLTPAVLHILIALAESEKHGYAIMKQVEIDSKSKVSMGPGTLYGSLTRQWARCASTCGVRLCCGRDEPRPVHDLPRGGARQSRRLQPGGIAALRVHGLAASGRAAGGGGPRLHQPAQLMRLEQDQRRHGLVLSLQARAGGGVQTGPGTAREHHRARPLRPLPVERVGLCRRQHLAGGPQR